MKSILSFCFLIILSKCFSQEHFNSLPILGPKVKDMTGPTQPIIFGASDNAIYTLSVDPFSVVLNKFSKNSFEKEIKSLRLKFKYNGNNLELVRVLFFNGEPLFITAFRNSEKSIKHFFFQKMLENGDFSTPKPFADIEWEEDYRKNALSSQEKIHFIQFSISQDGRYLSTVYPKSIISLKKRVGVWKAQTFDKNLDKIWEQSYEPGSSKNIISASKVDNNGNIYMTSSQVVDLDQDSIYSENRSQFLHYNFNDYQDRNFIEGINHTIVKLTKETKSEQHLREEFEFSNFSLSIIDDKIYIYGIHKIRNDSEYKLKFIVLDEELQLQSDNNYNINQDVLIGSIDENLSGTNRKKSEPNFFFGTLLKTKDGNLKLIAEEYLFYQSIRHFQTESYTSDNHEFGNILIFSINKESKLEWSTQIKRFQYVYDDNGLFGSYFTTLVGDNLFVLANTISSEDEDELSSRKEKRYYLSTTQIYPDGKLMSSKPQEESLTRKIGICLRYAVYDDDKLFTISRSLHSFSPLEREKKFVTLEK